MFKRYLISSEKFIGEVDTHYVNGVLQKLDFKNCEMTTQQKEGFKQVLPMLETSLQDFGKRYYSNVVPTEYEATFDDFWNGYGRKLNKDRSEKLWAKMSKTEQVLCIMSLPDYHAWRNRYNKWPYDADRYLRERMWENEWKKLKN